MKINQLLTKEEKWTKGAMARDSKGKAINCLDIMHYDQGRRTVDLAKNAMAWSLYGAISYCYDSDDHENVMSKIHSAFYSLFGADRVIAEFNDHEYTTFENVKAIIKEAGI